jgi:hypothetical protein
MVTTFNVKDLVIFGNYMLSEEREELFASHPQHSDKELLKERLKSVHHSDIENFKAMTKAERLKFANR